MPGDRAPDRDSLGLLTVALDAIHGRSLGRALAGERDVTLFLRREYDLDGTLCWQVREDRDVWLAYARIRRLPGMPWPSRRAAATLEFVRAVHRDARDAALARRRVT